MAAVVAFAATAALAVTLSRGGSTHAALASARDNASGTHASGTHGASQPCTSSRLKTWLGTAAGAGYRLEFTNTSDTACTLSGYPVVSAVLASGRQAGDAAAHDTSAVAAAVELAPGATAHALAANAAALPADRCEPVAAAGLRVAAPGQAGQVPGQAGGRYVRHALTACSAAGPRAPVFLRVRAVQPGRLTHRPVNSPARAAARHERRGPGARFRPRCHRGQWES
jgi:hypothetical protein